MNKKIEVTLPEPVEGSPESEGAQHDPAEEGA